jgi:hypothetical protein
MTCRRFCSSLDLPVTGDFFLKLKKISSSTKTQPLYTIRRRIELSFQMKEKIWVENHYNAADPAARSSVCYGHTFSQPR